MKTPLTKQQLLQELKKRGVKDKHVLTAIEKVPREFFVEGGQKLHSYENKPLPIGHGQTISQPLIVALMSELCEIKKGDRVLEIGTGSGYQAAVLAELGADVYTIERIQELQENAKKNLRSAGYKNIHFKHGDGFKGWPEEAPFDTIILTASPAEIPQALLDQLKINGKLIGPEGVNLQTLIKITRTESGFEREPLFGVAFVPMLSNPD